MSVGLSPNETESRMGDLIARYPLPAAGYDEMFAAAGSVRPYCRPVAEAFAGVGIHELALRRDQAVRLVHENGVTYAAAEDARGKVRPWELDVLPLVLEAQEWRAVTEGLAQRARLLNLVLADLYGPQKLFQRGVLPVELLFAHPAFLRALHGHRVSNDQYLHVYAADLARNPDGQWVVVGDRTELPTRGMGYALENRIVVSRVFPNIVHDCHIERLAPFFIALQETLARLAPRFRENPRIVLWSPGARSPNYFEDAYLARYLGYPLVEAGDLAVRSERVMLKTLGGLRPVEVILRRVDSGDCDPLELRPQSRTGVTGLMQAVRAGNVVVANSLGTGIVESPVFLAFLPRLFRELLGEEPKLASVPTWWCGDPASCRYVLERLSQLAVLPAFRTRGDDERIWGSGMGADKLAEAIRARPHAFVAQEPVLRSTTPAWVEGELRPWQVALRAYLVASRGSFTAMAGGLTRVAASADVLAPSITAGHGSKDAWVLADGPVRPVSLLKQSGRSVMLVRSGVELPSRMAEHLYWLGRQVERVDGTARLLRTTLLRLTGESETDAIPELPFLLRVLSDRGQIDFGSQVVEVSAVFDAGRPGRLRHSIMEMHRLGSIVRDRLSIDSWRILNRIEQDFRPDPRLVEPGEILGLLNPMVIDLAAFGGLVMESMTRGHGWRFLDLGRRLERAQYTIGLVRCTLATLGSDSASGLQAVLEVADSSMTYRSRYLANLHPAAVFDLLLTDESNPRSVAFQIAALADHVEQLPRDSGEALRSPEQRLALSALHAIRTVDLEMLCPRQNGERSDLERLLTQLGGQLPKLSDAICHRYFVHAGATRQMADLRPGDRA